MAKRTHAAVHSLPFIQAPTEQTQSRAPIAARTSSGSQAKVSPEPLIPVLTVPDAEEDEDEDELVDATADENGTADSAVHTAPALAFEQADYAFWSDRQSQRASQRPSYRPSQRASYRPSWGRLSLAPRPKPSLLRSIFSKLLFLVIFGAVCWLLGKASSVMYESDAYGIRSLYESAKASVRAYVGA